jgi:putative membrane protein
VVPAPGSFTFEPLFLVLGAAAVAAYVRAARTERPAWWRIALFALGIALVVVPLNSPLETIAIHYLLLAHLLQNVMLADWAPPLLVLSLTPAMRASLGRRIPRVLVRPRNAIAIWLVGWYGIHASLFYDYALRNHWALNLEHGVLVAIGLLFWWPVLAREQGLLSTPGTLAYLGAAFAASSFLGLALIFSTSAFYSFYEHAPRLWGLSPAKDQNLGGLVMNGEQTIVFLAALVYFLLRLLAEEEEATAAMQR